MAPSVDVQAVGWVSIDGDCGCEGSVGMAAYWVWRSASCSVFGRQLLAAVLEPTDCGHSKSISASVSMVMSASESAAAVDGQDEVAVWRVGDVAEWCSMLPCVSSRGDRWNPPPAAMRDDASGLLTAR